MKRWVKIAGAAFSLVLAAGIGVGGTLAWLATKTNPVINTFTAGNVSIEMDETDVDKDDNLADNKTMPDGTVRDKANAYTLIPGASLLKDPQIRVGEDSQPCIVFLKLENGLKAVESTEYRKPIASQLYDMGWNLVPDTENIYAMTSYGLDDIPDQQGVEVSIIMKAGSTLDTFTNFFVNENATAEELKAVENQTITVTAYAVQAEGLYNFEKTVGENIKAIWNAAQFQ